MMGIFASAMLVSGIAGHVVHEEVIPVHFVPFAEIQEICRQGTSVEGIWTGCTHMDATGLHLELVIPTPSTWPGTDKAYRCLIEHEGNHFNGWPREHPNAKDCK